MAIRRNIIGSSKMRYRMYSLHMVISYKRKDVGRDLAINKLAIVKTRRVEKNHHARQDMDDGNARMGDTRVDNRAWK